MGAKGKVTSLLQKRDKILAVAIQNAVAKNLPLDSLSSRKKDYDVGGKLSTTVMGKPSIKRGGNNHSKYKSRGSSSSGSSRSSGSSSGRRPSPGGPRSGGSSGGSGGSRFRSSGRSR